MSGEGGRDAEPDPARPASLQWVLRPDLSGQGRKPDYRFSLANERTFLAYVRTSLALLAGGIAVVQLVPRFGVPGGRQALAVLLVLLSLATAASSYRRWWLAEFALRHDTALPGGLLPRALALGLVVVCLMALVLVLLSAGPEP